MTGVDGFLFLKVLAFFRFFVLLLAYAIVRLRHWWVIAVRRQFLLSCFEFSLYACSSQGSEIRKFIFSGHYIGIQCLPDCEGHPLRGWFPWAHRGLLCDYLMLLFSRLCKLPVVSAFFHTASNQRGFRLFTSHRLLCHCLARDLVPGF